MRSTQVSKRLSTDCALCDSELKEKATVRGSVDMVRRVAERMLGGVAKMESAPTTARSEFRIAVVGPLGSAACGVVFYKVRHPRKKRPNPKDAK